MTPSRSESLTVCAEILTIRPPRQTTLISTPSKYLLMTFSILSEDIYDQGCQFKKNRADEEEHHHQDLYYTQQEIFHFIPSILLQVIQTTQI